MLTYFCETEKTGWHKDENTCVCVCFTQNKLSEQYMNDEAVHVVPGLCLETTVYVRGVWQHKLLHTSLTESSDLI